MSTNSGGSSYSKPHVTPSPSTLASAAIVFPTATPSLELLVAPILEEEDEEEEVSAL